MEHLDGILKLVETELGVMEKNGRFRSREEIDTAYKLIDIAKDIQCMEDGDYSYAYDDYSNRGRKRDSMGRYSRNYPREMYAGDWSGTYARDGKEDYKNQLRDLMDEAPDEQTRKSIKRMIDAM